MVTFLGMLNESSLFTFQGLFGMGGTPESFGPYLGGAGMGLSGGGAVGQSAHMKLPPQSLHLPQQQQQAGSLASKQGTGFFSRVRLEPVYRGPLYCVHKISP